MKMNTTKIEHYISRLTPNVYPLNALLIAPHFYRRFGRLPRRPTRPDADYHDFLVNRMVRNGWSDFHLKCVDKEHAKAAALELAPEVRVPPTIEVIPTPRGISLGYLRERLMPYIGKHLIAKPTQSSGLVVFLDDFDDGKLRSLFSASRYDYFYSFRETQYHGLPSKIIVEENMADGDDLFDYKFFCANGDILFTQADSGRFIDHRRVLLMPPDFEPVYNLRLGVHELATSWQKPAFFDEMIRLAGQLSRPFDFVRVDLFSTTKGLFMGEFTFTPGAGMETFSDPAFGKDLLRRIYQSSNV